MNLLHQGVLIPSEKNEKHFSKVRSYLLTYKKTCEMRQLLVAFKRNGLVECFVTAIVIWNGVCYSCC